MRVLSVSATPPYPPNDGVRLRTWHLLSRVAEHAQTTLLYFEPPDYPAEYANVLRRAFAEVIVMPFHETRRSTAVRVGGRGRFVAGGLPPYVQHMLAQRDLSSPAVRHRLEQEVRLSHTRSPFDVVVCEEEAVHFFPVPDIGVPVLQHRLTLFVPMIAALSRHRPLTRALWLLDGPGWRRFDRLAQRGAARVVTPTPEMAVELRRMLGFMTVTVIGNGTDVRPLRTSPADGHDVAFIGQMSHGPNIDAAQWFSRRIWPELSRRHPDSRFRIVGRDPSPSVLELASDTVVVSGTVPDLTDACEGARVGVVPLRGGMGIKNKTLNLMALGLPVVSTIDGVEGITARDDDGVILVEGAAAMLEAVSCLLADPARAARLGAAARAWVSREFSWDAIAQTYLHELEATAATGRGPQRQG